MSALCARIAAEGAFLSLKKDAARYIDKTYVADMLSKADNLFLSVIEKERIILRIAERSTLSHSSTE